MTLTPAMLRLLGKRAFASTFAAFFTRSFDQIRMAAVSKATIHLTGSHAGVSIGEDGPSQMALEDLAMMRAVHGSTVLYPSDAASAAYLTAQMADVEGIVYIRTTRGAYPVLYGPDEKFPVGGAKVVERCAFDQVAVAGVHAHHAVGDGAEQVNGVVARNGGVGRVELHAEVSAVRDRVDAPGC